MSQLKNGSSQCLWTSSLFIVLLLVSMTQGAISSNYGEALTKSILYFEAQRSGKLPSDQRVRWRGDSALRDGSDVHVDLTGGYYDAGDNTKFGFPLAFTTTMLAWSSVEMASQLKAHEEHTNLLTAIKWATDYLIKAHPEPNVLYGQVGDGNSDHACWMRPEDMGTTPRPSYRIDAQHPGADLAGETAAAMAAASVAFAPSNAAYAQELIVHAEQLFDFAVAHPGTYQSSISNAGGFYASSGYQDELLWAAAWLYRATDKQTYLNYLNEASNIGGARTVFAWDDKFLGAQVLMAKLALEGKVKSNKLDEYKSMAEQFICNCAQKGSSNVKKTHGGLLCFLPWNNLQYTTSASFILSAYSNYLEAAHVPINCPGGTLPASDLLNLAREQVDYILGSNPKSMSYMVGYGSNYPTRPHHRGASIVSIKTDKTRVECKAGFNEWYNNPAPNPNVLTGGLVGGPDENDAYDDVRTDYQRSEPVLVTVAPFVGVLAAVA